MKRYNKGRTDWDAGDTFVVLLSFVFIVIIILERALKVI